MGDPGWIVSVTLERRADGGLLVYSDDLPGLILSGSDPQKVAGDIPTAIQVLIDYKMSKGETMTDEQIKYMVNRFLGWKLPESFNPDGGVSFQRKRNEGTPYEFKSEPSGTNLLDADQANAMVRYMIDGMP